MSRPIASHIASLHTDHRQLVFATGTMLVLAIVPHAGLSMCARTASQQVTQKSAARKAGVGPEPVQNRDQAGISRSHQEGSQSTRHANDYSWRGVYLWTKKGSRTVHVKVIFIMNPVIEFSCHHITVVISHGSCYLNYMQARVPPRPLGRAFSMHVPVQYTHECMCIGGGKVVSARRAMAKREPAAGM